MVHYRAQAEHLATELLPLADQVAESEALLEQFRLRQIHNAKARAKMASRQQGVAAATGAAAAPRQGAQLASNVRNLLQKYASMDAGAPLATRWLPAGSLPVRPRSSLLPPPPPLCPQGASCPAP